MNMSTLGETILVTMRAIENPDAVSKKERKKNRQVARGAEYAYWTTHAAARAAEYVYIGNYEKAQEWVDKYFEFTNEKKQDYINHIKREK